MLAMVQTILHNNLPATSRVWIYQANRILTDAEVSKANDFIQAFLPQWKSHGKDLAASIEVLYHLFIVVTADEGVEAPSGCSIDSSVAFIQKLEQKYQVDLLDKMNVTFKNGEHIAHKSLIDFKRMAKEKAVTANTIVFNNLVNSIEEFNENWEVPAGESWHSRFF